jgi:hypothetical protein
MASIANRPAQAAARRRRARARGRRRRLGRPEARCGRRLSSGCFGNRRARRRRDGGRRPAARCRQGRDGRRRRNIDRRRRNIDRRRRNVDRRRRDADRRHGDADARQSRRGAGRSDRLARGISSAEHATADEQDPPAGPDASSHERPPTSSGARLDTRPIDQQRESPAVCGSWTGERWPRQLSSNALPIHLDAERFDASCVGHTRPLNETPASKIDARRSRVAG